MSIRRVVFQSPLFPRPSATGILIEAMIQVLQWYMIERDLGKDYRNPRFTCLGLNQSMQWKYRGQVVPENKVITTMDVIEVGKTRRRFCSSECFFMGGQ